MTISRRGFFGFLTGSAAMGAGLSVWASRMKTYDGPVSDHFDGTRFFDPHGASPRPVGDLLRWRFTRNPSQWPAHAPSGFCDEPPARVTGERIRFSYIGHASWLIQTAGLNILIDPIWSERCSPVSFAGPKRVNAPGVAFEKLPPIDTVLVTHGHYDHLDLRTLSNLAGKFAPRVITPLGNDVTMKAGDPAIRAEVYDWHQHAQIGNGIVVHLVPTRHWSARGLFDRNKALWASFVIETPAGKIYAVGDSGYGDGGHFRRVREAHGALRIALLPIGAYEPRWFMSDQHMNPEDAVKALADCGAEMALAHHHGTFQLTDEAIDAPVNELVRAREAAGLAPERFLALKPGQTFEL